MSETGKQEPIEVNATNVVNYIMDFESGELSDEGTIALFQYLIDSGQLSHLQGFYGRAAVKLINLGLCHR